MVEVFVVEDDVGETVTVEVLVIFNVEVIVSDKVTVVVVGFDMVVVYTFVDQAVLVLITVSGVGALQLDNIDVITINTGIIDATI